MLSVSDLKKVLGLDRENNLKNDVTLSFKAQEVLENEAVQNFFKETEETFTRALVNSKDEDYDYRERMYQYVKILRSFKSFLEAYLVNGKISDEELKKLAKS